MSYIALIPAADFEKLGLAEPSRAVYRDMKYVPTTVQELAHFPAGAKGFLAMAAGIGHGLTISPRLTYLISLVCSRAAQCGYCTAHAARLASLVGVPMEQVLSAADLKFDADPKFTDAERAAMRIARDGSTVPNTVGDEHYVDLAKYFSPSEIVEIVSQMALMGFLNRFNDTIASPLEPESLIFAEKVLAPIGWKAGKHAPTTNESAGIALK